MSHSSSYQNHNLAWWISAARFWGFHIACLAGLWLGFDAVDIAICVGLYLVRMFGVTAGYHRYFSHRTYKMGRGMQFAMAFLAQTSFQKGVLWWASHHRHHHKHSDQPEDVHSVKQAGFWWAHVGWIFDERWDQTEMSRVKDLARYPELLWLDRWHAVPPAILAAVCLALGGWTGLVVWFMWSTVLLWHGTFAINSLAHVFGRRRYETTDDSKNSFILAVITLGEGWHNNHHHFQASVNQGFYWWEVDFTYYTLWAFSKVGLVHDLKRPPLHVVEDRPHPVVAFRQAAAEIKADAIAAMDELTGAARHRATAAHVIFEEGVARAKSEAHDLFEDGMQRMKTQRDTLVRRFDDMGNAIEEAAIGFEDRLSEIERMAEAHLYELEQSAIQADREAMKMADEIAASARRALSEIQEKGQAIRQATAQEMALSN